jgi:hypothetical protein
MFCVNLIDDLPVVQDNRKAEPQKYNDEVMREVNCEKNIERDEYIQKKKPKGKAKFIGQSKAEKVLILKCNRVRRWYIYHLTQLSNVY